MADIAAHELGGLTTKLCKVFTPVRCALPAQLHGNGFALPLCEYHLRMLPRPMFDELVVLSTVSVWDSPGTTRALAHLRACLTLIRRQTLDHHP